MYKVGEEIRMSVEEAQKIIDFGVDSISYWELRGLALNPVGLNETEYDKLVSDLRVVLNGEDKDEGIGKLITEADVGITQRSWWDCMRNMVGLPEE